MDNLILLKDIYLSNEMAKIIRKYKPYIDLSEYKIYDVGDLPLNLSRLDSVIEAITNDKVLPPVDLKIIKLYRPPRKKTENDKMYFSILNGRHRVVASIISNHTHIRAKLFN